MIMELSRRSFLKGAASVGIVSAAAGLAGCAPSASNDAKKTAETDPAQASAAVSQRPTGYMCDENWLGSAPEIADADIAETKSFDVVVVGGGHAGTQAALAAAQEGAKVAVIEKHKDGEIVYRGDDICSYNSKMLESWGFGPYDLEEIVNEYVRRAAGRCNTAVIRSFVYNSGEMMDNLASIVPDTSTVFDYEGRQCTVQVAHEQPDGSAYPIEKAGYKQWASTVQTLSTMNEAPVGKNQLTGVTRLAELEIYSREAAEDLGAQWFCEQTAVTCVQGSDGAVTGIIAQDADGKYVKYEAAKGVILSTGDFGANYDMVWELCSECGENAERHGVPKESLIGMTDCDGSGHKIGCWAGGAIESHPRPVAGSAPVIGFGPIGSTPCLWVNSLGNRFMNEEMSSSLLPQSIRQPVSEDGTIGNMAVTDKNYMAYIEKAGIDHGSPNWGFPEGFDRFTAAMEGKPEGGAVTVPSLVIASVSDQMVQMLSTKVFKGDTVEEAFKSAGLTGDALKNAVATVEHYNELCAQGSDPEFGKSADTLLPLTEPPFYVYPQATTALYGPGLNTLAGLCVTGDYEVLNMAKTAVIPNLYAVGNVMGERYGNSYNCPSAGNNMGNALTSGRVAGKKAAAK
ncbi:FAD-binding protein [Eggerthella sinensis]|nr:FAD-binding protein [Eggerthella sinensis]